MKARVEIYNVNLVMNNDGDIQQNISSCHQCPATLKIERIDERVGEILAILEEQKQLAEKLLSNHILNKYP